MSVKFLFSVLVVLTFFHTTFFTVSHAQYNQIEIVLSVPDTLVSSGEDSGILNVYLDNFNYELFGFQFVLKSNRPDLVTFDFAGLGYQSNGTLVDGFEYIEAIDKAGDKSEYWFRCIADLAFIPGTRDGIFPQQGGIAIKIPFTTTNSPDTSISLTSLLSIELPTDFSDRDGFSIGVIPDTLVDTTYYNCSLWVNDSCASFIEVIDTSLGYEFIHYDSIVIGLLDPEIVFVNEGSITLDIPTTGNCDLNYDGEIDISDLVLLVGYMFLQGAEYWLESNTCNFDSDNFITISDLVGLVTYMFNSGPPPPNL